MKIISILLLIVGIAGIIFSTLAFGDIGIACFIGGAAALLSGINFLILAKKLAIKPPRE